jgi:hypothetical protein
MSTTEKLDVDSLTNSSTRFPSGVWRILAVMYSNMMERDKEDKLRGLGRLMFSGEKTCADPVLSAIPLYVCWNPV